MNVIETRGLTKQYGPVDEPVVALRGVDLAIATGEMVAVMGPSGCGKSTLLHLLGGLDRPSAGEIMLHGERVDELSEAAWSVKRRREVGYVFQYFNLIGNLSAQDNVELAGHVAGLSRSEARRRRVALMEELGIAGRGSQLPSRLSGGERQRVAIARALINRPALLLADEPTGSLDSSSAHGVMELFRRLHGEGQTIVLVTHDARVASAADRVIRMADGLIVSESRMRSEGDERTRLADLVTLGL